MIGQQNLVLKLNKFTLGNLPHSILLIGDDGSEYKEICKYMSNRFDLQLIDFTDNISNDYISQIYLSTVPTLYLIDLYKITENDQNVILKLLEEPNEYTYLVLYGESLFNVLETISNRSYIMYMDKYYPEQLRPLVTNPEADKVLSLCTTPGQIEVANHTNLTTLFQLCHDILNRLDRTGIGNSIRISDKINFKDEYDKYDLRIFIKVFGELMLEENKFSLYKHLLDFNKKVWFMNDKKHYFEYFIINIWQEVRNS